VIRGGKIRLQRQNLLHRLGCLGALADEVIAEERPVRGGFLIMMRRQRDRKAGNAGFQPDIHQPGHHRAGDEIVTIDAAIDDKGGGHDGIIAPGPGQFLGQTRHLEGAGNVEGVDPRAGKQRGCLGQKTVMGTVHDLGVPAGLDEGDAGIGLGHLSEPSVLQQHRPQSFDP